MMMINVDRLRAELEFVTANPDRWRQGVWLDTSEVEASDAEPGRDWTCGTTACLAGWAALHHGYVPHVVRYDDGDVEVADDFVSDPDGKVRYVRDAACEVLSLPVRAARYLFDAANSLRDLWEYARVLTRGAIEVPPAVAATSCYVFDPELSDEYHRERLGVVTRGDVVRPADEP